MIIAVVYCHKPGKYECNGLNYNDYGGSVFDATLHPATGPQRAIDFENYKGETSLLKVS
jgi:hypothetical protein